MTKQERDDLEATLINLASQKAVLYRVKQTIQPLEAVQDINEAIHCIEDAREAIGWALGH